MLIRDPSHAIRIAVSRPLKMEETFKDIFLELIGPEKNERNKLACGSRGALIPDLTDALRQVEGDADGNPAEVARESREF